MSAAPVTPIVRNPLSLVVLRLEGERYTEVGRVEGDGRLAVAEPFPVTLDGTALFGDPPDEPTA